MSMPDRWAMIDPANDNLSVRRQCQLLQVTRSGVYRPKSPTAANDLERQKTLADARRAFGTLSDALIVYARSTPAVRESSRSSARTGSTPFGGAASTKPRSGSAPGAGSG